MDTLLETHRRNLKETYRYSYFSLALSCVIIIAMCYLAITRFIDREIFSAFLFLILAVFNIFLAISIARYRVDVSSLGISIYTGWKESYLPWGEIQSWKFSSDADSLYLNGVGKISINLPFAIHGFDELWETLRTERPGLFEALPIRKFHGYNSVFIYMLFIAIIGLGIAILSSPSLKFADIAFPAILILVGIAGLVWVMRTKRSIELGKTDLVIRYPFTEKRIPITDIVEIRKGVGVQTRSSKFVSLGGVKEGKAALYDALLDWWRASQPQS